MQPMQSPDAKLARGLELAEQAGESSDLLGVAMLALQAALEDQLRAMLATHHGLDPVERQALAGPSADLTALVEIAQRHGDLSRDERWRILDAEKLRQSFIAGEPFRGSPAAVRSYGVFVAELCGAPELPGELARLAAPDEDDAPEPRPARWDAIARVFVGALVVALLAYAGWLAYDRVLAPPRRAAPAPTPAATTQLEPIVVASPTPEARPSPTPATRQGRIVRLGGGPGWLHESPSFSSLTLPPRLAEGDVVTILGPEQADADGVPWIFVAFQGYEGWSPLNNVEEIR